MPTQLFKQLMGGMQTPNSNQNQNQNQNQQMPQQQQFPMQGMNGNSMMNYMMRNPQGVMRNIEQFGNALSGNPKAMVDNLLQSGRMTQAQYNMLEKVGRQFQSIMTRRR